MKNKIEDKKEITLDMRFRDIKIIKFSQFDLEKEITSSKSPLVEFQTGFQFRVIENEDILACLITVKIVLIETREDFAELKVENLFEIKPFSEIIKKREGNNLDVPNGILTSIVSISASTVRGILFEKLKGTIVQNEIYPLIEINSIFQELKK